MNQHSNRAPEEQTPPADPFDELANAIVLKAVSDYKNALRMLKKFPAHHDAAKEKRSIERFFASDWCKLLTRVDMVMVARKLREEIMKK